MRVSYKVSIRAQISRAKFRQILRLFALDLTAVQIAELAHLNRNTVNRYLKLIRRQVASFCESESPFTGEVELDESYFGAKACSRQARPRSLRENDRLRHLQAQRQRLYRDRP
jgi:hypothetical protein